MGEHVGDRPKSEHDTFDEFMEMERARIQKHAQRKMARALGYALPGESQQELNRIAAEGQSRAPQGIVKLKIDDSVHYKHIDELTCEDRATRIAAEREVLDWLIERLRLRNERS
jgi:hypothetical protein